MDSGRDRSLDAGGSAPRETVVRPRPAGVRLGRDRSRLAGRARRGSLLEVGPEGVGRAYPPWIRVASVGLVLVIYLAFTWRANFLCDDAYISFRYARNLAEGHGFVFNPGQGAPVEGVSNLLWVWILTPISAAGFDLGVASRVLSIASGLLLLGLVHRVLDRRLRLGYGSVLFGTLFVALSPPIAVWSTGGLATMPFALGVFWLYERLLGDPGQPRARGAAVAAASVVMLRAEGLAWVLLFVLPAGYMARGGRNRGLRAAVGQVLLVALLVQGALVAWRLRTFGVPFPNTVYAKVGLTAEQVVRGGHYGLATLTVFPATLIGLALIPAARRRMAATAWVGAMAGVFGTLAFCVFVGGDFMAMFRFAVPAIAPLAILMASGVDALAPQGGVRRALVVVAVLGNLVGATLPHFGVEPVRSLVRSLASDSPRPVRSQWERLNGQRNSARDFLRLGEALRQASPEGSSLIARGIGAVGYRSDLRIFDAHGLTSAEVAHAPIQRSGVAGHDLLVGPAFFEHHRPTYAFAGLIPRGRLDSTGAAYASKVFPFTEDQALRSVYRPFIVEVPSLAPEEVLLLAVRDPTGDGSDHPWDSLPLGDPSFAEAP